MCVFFFFSVSHFFTGVCHSHTPSVSGSKKPFCTQLPLGLMMNYDDTVSIRCGWRSRWGCRLCQSIVHPYRGIIYVQYYPAQLPLIPALTLMLPGSFNNPITQRCTLSGSASDCNLRSFINIPHSLSCDLCRRYSHQFVRSIHLWKTPIIEIFFSHFFSHLQGATKRLSLSFQRSDCDWYVKKKKKC